MGLDRSKLSVDQLAQLEQYEANKKQLEALEGIGKKLQSVVVAIQAQQSKGEKGTGDLGTLLMDIRESLDELKDKEDPEQPDFSKPVVEALSKLEKAITTSVKGIDVKPQVNVDAKTPEVDLSGVEKVLGTLPKAFDKAVKSIPKVDVPETDFKPLVDKLDELGKQLADIDTGVRMKPTPGTMKVTNPDGTEVGSQFGGLTPNVDYDYLDVQQTSSTVDTFVFKSGGSGGTTVLTIVVTYTDSTKSDINYVSWA